MNDSEKIAKIKELIRKKTIKSKDYDLPALAQIGDYRYAAEVFCKCEESNTFDNYGELPPPKGRGFLIQRLRLPCAFAQGRGANLQRREFRQSLPY